MTPRGAIFVHYYLNIVSINLDQGKDFERLGPEEWIQKYAERFNR